MTTRQDIEIDYCPKCRGVWLDRGELDKIIERSQRDQTIAASSQASAVRDYGAYREESGHGRSGHGSSHGGSRHGSFLKRLFD